MFIAFYGFSEPTDFLNKEQTEIYWQWKKESIQHWKNGTHAWQRLTSERSTIKMVEPQWAAMWECPYEDGGGAPMKVTNPSGRCLGELVRGGIHCPIEAHWESKILVIAKDGQYTVVRQIDAEEVRIKMRINNGGIANEFVVDYRRPHNEIGGPMSVQEAHEYIFAKDVPQYVWGRERKYNKPKFCIVPYTMVPAEDKRHLRNAWRLSDTIEMKEYQDG